MQRITTSGRPTIAVGDSYEMKVLHRQPPGKGNGGRPCPVESTRLRNNFLSGILGPQTIWKRYLLVNSPPRKVAPITIAISPVEAYRRLRLIRPDVKVILSSGYSDIEALSKFSGKDLAGFLKKPFTAAQLGEVVKQAFSEQSGASR